MRDLVLTAVIVGLLPMALIRPWVGVLLWSWIGYMNPHRLTWGFASNAPWALLIGGATLLGMLFARDRRPIPMVRETFLLMGLWIMFTITTIFALFPDAAWPQWERVSKILLFTFITMKFFQDRERFRYLFILIAFSIGFYGVKGFFFTITTGGQHLVYGPERSFIGSNNSVGLALNMVLPFLYLLPLDEPRRWVRRLMYFTFWTSSVAVIFTYSRGAFLGLAVVMTLLFLKGSKHLLTGVATFLAAAIFFLTVGSSLIPERWWARMGTIATYDEDRSALGRLESWRIAYEIATDRPFLGGGFWVLPQPEMRARFNSEKNLSAHSIYFAVMGDHGFITFGLFVGLLVSCLVSLRGLRRRAAREPDLAWLVAPTKMLEVSLAAFMVSGAFQTEAYFDLFYHVVAGVILLRVLAARNEAAPAAAVEPAVPPEAAIATGRRPLPAARAARAARAERAR